MKELGRKLIHLLFGIGIAGLILLVPAPVNIQLLATGLLGGLILMDLSLKGYRLPLISRLLESYERKDAFPGKGAFFFVLSALALTLLVPQQTAFLSVLVLAVLDSASGIFGYYLGKHRIHNGKSVEGFVSGIVVTAAVLLVWIPIPVAFLVAIVAGIAELISPVDDNLIIPIVAAIVLLLV